MKKISLSILVATICVMVACGPPPVAKNYSCKEYSLDCELLKDHILIHPITFSSTIVDAFGDPIKSDNNNQWYLINPKVQVLVPVPVSVPIPGTSTADYGPDYTHHPTTAILLSYLITKDEKIRIDSTDLRSIVRGLTKAMVVVSGPNEIVTVNDDNNDYVVDLALPKPTK